MKLDKTTLMTVAGLYTVGSVLTLLYVQPWDARWGDDKTKAWEYVVLWPYAIYKLGTK